MSEEELDIQESERKYRSLFESSRDAIMILEPPSWNFTSGNPSTVKLFKAKDEAEFITHGPGDVSPAMQPDGRDSGEKAKEMIGTAMRDGSNFFEWTHKRIDGAEFAAEVLLTRMELGGKTILQATVRDITERKKAEDALHSANAGLEARMSQLNEISKALISDIGIQRATGIIYENGWRLGQRKARPLHESWKGDKKSFIEDFLKRHATMISLHIALTEFDEDSVRARARLCPADSAIWMRDSADAEIAYAYGFIAAVFSVAFGKPIGVKRQGSSAKGELASCFEIETRELEPYEVEAYRLV